MMDKLIEWGDGLHQYRDEPETVFVEKYRIWATACLYNTQASLLMDEIQTAFRALMAIKRRLEGSLRQHVLAASEIFRK